MQGLRVLLLGPPRLELDGQALTRLMAAKHQALVFHLAAEGRAVPRTRLAGILWGDLDEAPARANLRVALTRLRRWLPSLLDIDAQQVGFAAGAPVSVDLQALEQALHERERPPAERAAAARAWRGPLLDGFDVAAGDDFERWLVHTRQRAARAAVALRRDLMQRCMAEGRPDEAIEHAHGVLEIDDADEPAHMELMRLLAARGRRIAAIAQYETCRAALAERLGARPSADCYALYTRIHADAPPGRPVTADGMVAHAVTADAPVARPPAPLVGEADGGPLIGRDVELAQLRERLALPECRWLTVVGPGGVGKTRLALAAAAELGSRLRHGVLWLSGRDEGGALRDAETLVQRVLERIGSDREAGGALLLVLDNLETVPGARALMQTVLARAPGVTGLATSRTRVGGPREWLLELTGLSLQREAEDRPASSPAAQLLSACAHRLDAGFDAVHHAERIEELCARVGGLPLALEMAARGLHRAGPDAVVARLRSGVPLEDPDRDPHDRHHSIDLVLEESWALLPHDAQQGAVRVALLPGAFDLPLAAGIGVGEAAIDTLRAHSWLTLSDNGRLALHPLQQDFLRRRPEAQWFAAKVHEGLAHSTMAVLPVVDPFGDWVRRDEDDDAAAVSAAATCSAPVLAETARHLCADGTADALVPWIDRAVALLLRTDRAAEAAALLEGACARSDLPSWQVTGWMLRRAEALNRIGSSGAAMRAYARAYARLGLGDIGPDAPFLGGLAQALGRLAMLAGWPPPAQPAARQGYTRLVLRNLNSATQLFSFAPDARPSMRLNAAARVLARRAGSRAERLAAMQFSAYGVTLFGHAATGRWILRRAGAAPAFPSDPVLEGHTRECQAATRLALGCWDGLALVLDAQGQRLRSLGHDRYSIECLCLAAKLRFYQGHLRASWDGFAFISELSLSRPGDQWRAWGPFGQAEVGLCLGDVPEDELQRLVACGAHWMTEMENIDSAYTLRQLGLAARLAWRRGDVAAAREAVLAGVAAAARMRHCGFWAHEGYAGLGEGLLRLRAHERRIGGALAPLDAAWAAFDRALDAHGRRFPAGSALVHRLRGLAALEAGRLDVARRDLDAAVRVAEAQGLRVELARSCDALGSIEAGPQWSDRAVRQWRDMGALDMRGSELGLVLRPSLARGGLG